MRRFNRWSLIFCLLLLPQLTQAKRIALVFGNNNYAEIDDLDKAVNDASSMLKELTAAGFNVINKTQYKDLSRKSMLDARDSLFNALGAGDQVVVFYAGHGLQIGSDIFLLPTSYPITAATPERIAEESLALQSIMDGVRERIGMDGFALYVIDACRNNPLPKSKRRGIYNMLSRGLTPMQPPSGQIAIYSASNGQTALDRLGDDDADPNGVFTRILLKYLNTPGRPIIDILADVQEEVVQLAKEVIDDETGKPHEQQPAVYNEARIKYPFCFRLDFGNCGIEPVAPQMAPKEAPLAPTSITVDNKAVELKFWESVDKDEVEQIQDYLTTYPNGQFAKLAKSKLKKLTHLRMELQPKQEPQASPVPDDFEGTWTGKGFQYDNKNNWSIRITITGENYSIGYPSLNCGGQLLLKSKTENSLIFNEMLKYGQSVCIDNGITVIEKTGATSARFLWYFPDGKQGASGNLSRTLQPAR